MPRNPKSKQHRGEVVNRRAGPAHDHWLTLLPLFIAVVATATLVIGA